MSKLRVATLSGEGHDASAPTVVKGRLPTFGQIDGPLMTKT